jgi:hypothetical protein
VIDQFRGLVNLEVHTEPQQHEGEPLERVSLCTEKAAVVVDILDCALTGSHL